MRKNYTQVIAKTSADLFVADDRSVRRHILSKTRRISLPKILAAARGEMCTMNSPYCNHDPSSVVFCHLNQSYAGKGMGQKADDTAGFFGCSCCHDWYDGRMGPNVLSRTGYEGLYITLKAYVRTIRRLVEKSVLK